MYFVLKRPLLFLIPIVLMSVFWGVGVRADWDPNDPAKYVQMPDTVNGMDVNATYWINSIGQPVYPYNKMLADDFPCYQQGPITDLHIWGSWLGDVWSAGGVPTAAVNLNTQFKLSIYADVPAGMNSPYSHPGDVLWSQTFLPSEYSMRQWGDPTNELFYDPNTNTILGTDSRIWQYNFDIAPANAFVQQGTVGGQPTIYWLGVQALVPVDDFNSQVFGWKTTLPGANLYDDAVFADSIEPGGIPVGPGTGSTPWVDMHYPQGHVYYPASTDLAFAITPEPSTFVMLFFAGSASLFVVLRRRSKA